MLALTIFLLKILAWVTIDLLTGLPQLRCAMSEVALTFQPALPRLEEMFAAKANIPFFICWWSHTLRLLVINSEGLHKTKC